MGLLLCRLGWKLRVSGGFWVTSLLIVVLLCVPTLGGGEKIVDGIYQLVCILFVFPLILALGAGSSVKGKKSLRICKFLGDLSYPLYITHYPLIYLHTSWAIRYADAPVGTHVMVAISTLLIALFIAWAAFKLYDEPVREWLKNHWLKK